MPSDLPALFLESITGRFSEHNIIGAGGYAEVYKVYLINTHTSVQVISITNNELQESHVPYVTYLNKWLHNREY